VQSSIPLCPPPQIVSLHNRDLLFGERGFIHIPAGIANQVTWEMLQEAFHRWTSTSVQIETAPPHGKTALGRCHQEPEWSGHPEGYRLSVDPKGFSITAGTQQGIFYAAITLSQWLQGHSLKMDAKLGTIPGVTIEDWPAFANRGMMLDISRSKVPTMSSLFETVDLAARLKLNQLQLYMEHSFAYAGHETVWQSASPMTGPEIKELDQYCQERFIQLVPNQNSFGHFHQWLKHPTYRHLAECPEGIAHPFSLDLEPFSLCPKDPGTLALLEDLYDQLLPNFSSTLFNVGLDETFDLGQGRSKEDCERLGKTRVYLEFLNQVHQRIARRGKRMQFWGDIILEKPEALAELPEDVIAMEWGYEANHPFQEHCLHLAASKREYYVCPGTSSWSSVGGRIHNALANLASAAKAGVEHGASGYLITDWGDYGHFQPPVISLPAWYAGAAYSWNPASIQSFADKELQNAIALFEWEMASPVISQVLWELGSAYQDCEIQPTNGSSLFFLLLYADKTMTHQRLSGLTPRGLSSASLRLQNAKALLTKANITQVNANLVRQELLWAIDFLQVACDLGSEWALLPPDQTMNAISKQKRLAISERLAKLGEKFLQLRKKRFRPGGAQRSIRYLEHVQQPLKMP